MNHTILWLDDIRDPNTNNWLDIFSPVKPIYDYYIVWVKSYKEFKDWIDSNGLPTAICFDHDLGDVGDFNVKGRFDALFYNEQTNKWIIIDWKSSGTIDTVTDRWTKNLLGAAKQFPALNWYTYTMQLYFYKTALLNHYLPEGTKEEDVDVCIVNLPGDIFKIYKAAFNYDKKLMDDIFKFGYKKNYLLHKKKS